MNDYTPQELEEVLDATTIVPLSEEIGMYGLMRAQFLKQHRRDTFNSLALNNELNQHLMELDEEAYQMFDRLMPELAKKAGITEQLKATDPMRWVGLMNNCKAQANEIIQAELIYV